MIDHSLVATSTNAMSLLLLLTAKFVCLERPVRLHDEAGRTVVVDNVDGLLESL